MNTRELKENVQRIVSYIDSILTNLELDSDTEWYNDIDINLEFEKLFESKKIMGMKLQELEDDEYTFVLLSDFNERTSYDDIENKLLATLFSKINGKKENVNYNLGQKRELHILYRIPNVNIKIKRENIFSKSKKINILKNKINQENKKHMLPQYKKIKIHYICDSPRCKEEISLVDVNRFDLLQMPPLESNINYSIARLEKSEMPNSMGYVLTIQLKQIVELYNRVGDVLFKRNVRYGLEEQFGVDAAIKDTLKREPQKFWFRNNGITIVIENSDFVLDKSSKITLFSPSGNNTSIDFSVINGAQTITASAEYYYKLKNSEHTSEVKEELKNFEKANVLLRLIHVRADESERTKEVNEVSVALNRQKPIKAEDIAYTAPQVIRMLDYMTEHSECEFRLVKRGENVANGISLVDIARAMKAIKGKPADARSWVAKKLLEQNPETRRLIDEEVFPDFKNGEDADDVSSFEEIYKWVYFADSIASRYTKMYKNIGLSLKDQEKSILNNGKWYFVAYLIQCLSDTKNLDVSLQMNDMYDRRKLLDALTKKVDTNSDADKEQTYLGSLIRIFAEQMAKIVNSEEAKADMETLKIKQVDSNTFKSNKLFQFVLNGHDAQLKEEIMDNLIKCISVKSGQQINNVDAIEITNRSDRIKIKKVEIKNKDGINESISVKDTKEAYIESIQYIGNSYPEIFDKINDMKWITEEKNGERSTKIDLGGKIYYLNTNAGSELMRSRLQKMLEELNLPKDAICWYEENNNSPYYVQ